jgi:hypothetical protein
MEDGCKRRPQEAESGRDKSLERGRYQSGSAERRKTDRQKRSVQDKDGTIRVFAKGKKGPGESTGLNIKDIM